MKLEAFQPWLGRWSLAVDGESFATGVGSRLLPVLWGAERAILKITDQEEELRGGALMEWFGGVGAARVIARDGPALLLERLTGDQSLSNMARTGQDDEATRILCRTAQALHAPHLRLRPLSLSLSGFERCSPPLPSTAAPSQRPQQQLLLCS